MHKKETRKKYKHPELVLLRLSRRHGLMSNFSLRGNVEDYEGIEQEDF